MVQYHWYSPNHENIGQHEYTTTNLKTVKLKCIQIFPMYWFDPVFLFLFFRDEKSIWMMVLPGYIDIGDRCWRRNVLVTIIRCWWHVLPFCSSTFSIFLQYCRAPTFKRYRNSVTNILNLSPILSRQHHDVISIKFTLCIHIRFDESLS